MNIFINIVTRNQWCTVTIYYTIIPLYFMILHLTSVHWTAVRTLFTNFSKYIQQQENTDFILDLLLENLEQTQTWYKLQMILQVWTYEQKSFTVNTTGKKYMVHHPSCFLINDIINLNWRIFLAPWLMIEWSVPFCIKLPFTCIWNHYAYGTKCLTISVYSKWLNRKVLFNRDNIRWFAFTSLQGRVII